MKKLIGTVVLLLFFFLQVYSQDRGIGLRLGNPIGITYKKYFPRQHKAIELGLGSGYSTWYPHYYENTFNDFDRYEDFEYISHDVKSSLYFQGRYLLQNDIPIEGMVGRLEWYWGIGGLLKIAQVDFRYRDVDEVITSSRTDIDLGPEGILGMEYTFEDVPLTIFGELSLMIEIADRPLALRGFSGVGVRYNF
jgi:hypothetical protein